MNFTFKIGQKIKEGWVLYKENVNAFLLFTLLTFILSSVGQKENSILPILMMFINFLISFVWFRSTLNLIDKQEFKPFSREILPNLKQYWYLISTFILVGLISIVGLVLLIVPGLYFMGRLVFSCYIAVDKNKNAIDSIKESWNTTKGFGWSILGKSILIGLFVILGFIALFFGAFITYPIGMIIFAMLYREFEKFKNIDTGIKNI